MSGKRGSRGDSDGPHDEETGWLDDLKMAKKSSDAIDRTDFTTGGTDRWSRLSALSGDDTGGTPAQDARPPRGRARDRGAQADPPRRDAAEPSPGRGPVEPPRREPAGRRQAPPPEPEEPPARRSRPEPPEPDAKSLIGRRARQPDPDRDTGRHAPRSPFSDGSISPAPPPSGRGGASRADSSRSLFDGGAEKEPRHRPADPDEPRRRSLFGGADPGPGEEPRRRSPFGNRAAGDEPRRSPFADAVGQPVEEPRRRSPFGNRAAGDEPRRSPFAEPVEEPRRRSPFGNRGGAEEPRRSPFAAGGGRRSAGDVMPAGPAAPVSPDRPPGLKAPLAAAPETMGGPSRPLRGAGAVLGSAIPPSPAAATIRPNSPAAAGAPAARSRAGFAAGVQAIRGARSEVRRQLREQQRLRMWTLITLVVAIVGALPFYFVLRAVSRDPVITSLDALNVPSWAVVSKNDNINGSRWCLLDCRYRERTAESSKSIPETAKAYREALVGAGWLPMTNVPGCEPAEPAQASLLTADDHTCWRRDEFTLDLTVSEPACMQDKLRRRPGFDISPTPDPSAAAGGSAPPTPAPETECAGSMVHIKVFNAIDDIRLRWSPEPTVDPELEKLTNDDLNPTPKPTTNPTSTQ